MRIYYNDATLGVGLEKIPNSSGLQISMEHQPPFEERLREFRRKYKGPPIGGGPSEGWVDAGNYLLSYFLTDVFLSAMGGKIVGSLAWEVIKRSYKYLRDSGKIEGKVAVITDEAGKNGANTTILFTIDPKDVDEEMFAKAVAQIPEIRAAVVALMEVVCITDPITSMGAVDKIDFYFERESWRLNIDSGYRSPKERSFWRFWR